jgi:acetyltransferase-like isoleucine patch superfamily enzyme
MKAKKIWQYIYINVLSYAINEIRFHKNRVEGNCIFNSFRIKGSNNVIKVESIRNCKIIVRGDNNRIFIGKNGQINKCKFCIYASNSSIYIGDNNIISESTLSILDDSSTIKLGMKGYIGGARFFCIGKQNQILIGNNFLISDNVELWNGDGHSLIDNISKIKINEEKPIQISDNVWIGTGVMILKGVQIFENSIIAAKSIVTKDVPANTMVAGLPAKIIKNNVSWRYEKI